MEKVALLEKRGKEHAFSDVLLFIKEQGFLLYPLDRNILHVFIKVPKLEIHDRLIVAAAMLFDAVLITKDKEMQRAYQKSIW